VSEVVAIDRKAQEWDEQVARAKELGAKVESNQWEFAELCATICDRHGYGSKKRLAEELGYSPSHLTRIVKTWHVFGEDRIEGASFHEHYEKARVVNRKDKGRVLEALRQRQREQDRVRQLEANAAARSDVEELVAEADEARPGEPRTPSAIRVLRDQITELRVSIDDDLDDELFDEDLRDVAVRELHNAVRELQAVLREVRWPQR
jgi:hypothetical protein